MPGSTAFSISSSASKTMSEASRMNAISSGVLSSMPPITCTIHVIWPSLSRFQRRHDSLLHLVDATHSVDGAHDAAGLVVTSEQRGLGLVFEQPLPDLLRHVIRADDEPLAFLVEN